MRREAGFTLLEVLVAFLVFSMVFATVLQGLTGSLRNARRASLYTDAALWAASKMDELGSTIPLEEQSLDGDFDPRFRYHLEIREIHVGDQAPGFSLSSPVTLYHASLRVLWKDGRTEKQALFSTLKAVNRG